MKVLITGSGGLIGSACVALLCEQGWQVTGVDNDMRRKFFGDAGTTTPVVSQQLTQYKTYTHHDLDIRDRQGIRNMMDSLRPQFIIHTAAQPSHDRAAAIPYEDFDVNAVGTLNLLVAARDFCPMSPFCFTSTNKVYGDRPNDLDLVECESRYDYAGGRDGVDESMSIDACLHSLFGVSKVAADVLCQEFGRYFGMPVGIFRGGCLTGPQHAGVQLHGYLSYIVHCAVHKKPYTVFGYKGKQVRDQVHAHDVARLFMEFYRSPKSGEVYNLGGGRKNSLSVLETVERLASAGYDLQYDYDPRNRIGDHICYITDLTKVRAHFPAWSIDYDINRILGEMIEKQEDLGREARIQISSKPRTIVPLGGYAESS